MIDSGPERSVDSYCSYFYDEGAKLRQRYLDADATAESDPIGAIATVLASPHDLAVFFGHLAERAPSDIEDDVQTVADSFQKVADSYGDDIDDPLKGLASGIVNGFASAGATQRVDSWTLENCGPPPTD